jgi:hypothetical protein
MGVTPADLKRCDRPVGHHLLGLGGATKNPDSAIESQNGATIACQNVPTLSRFRESSIKV